MAVVGAACGHPHSLVLDAQEAVDGSEVEMNTKAKDLPEKLRDLQVGDDEGQVIF